MISPRATGAKAARALATWRWSLDWALSASVVPLAILVFAYAVYGATLPSAPPATNFATILVSVAAAIALAAMKLRELKRRPAPEGGRVALALGLLIPIAAAASVSLVHHSFLRALA